MRIYVTDDDDCTRECITQYLTDEGYEVLEAKDGDEALELIDNEGEPDLLWTDNQMPHLNGLGRNIDGLGLIEILNSAEDKFPVLICSKQKINVKEIKRTGNYSGKLAYLEKDGLFPMLRPTYIKAVEALIGKP